jgi:WD40 repeat protein
VLKGHTDIVSSVRVSLDDKQVVSGSRDKTLRVWDMSTGQCTIVLNTNQLSLQLSQNLKKTNNYSFV